MARRCFTPLVAFLVAALVLSSAALPASASDRDDITVMTYNIYQGTELQNSIAATTPTEFVLGAAADFRMMQQTNFPERAKAIAREIEAARPDLIGLQEVALWRAHFPFNGTPATEVVADFLQILLDTLAARGLRYVAVSSVNNFDVHGPALLSAGLTDVHLTDRNVVLARADGRGHRLRISNAQHANYSTNLQISTVGGPVTVLEGWASVDVRAHGRTFRFITTHLDAFVPAIRLAQATELLAGPAGTALPVLVVGDTNTTSTTATYAAFVAAGFVDVWDRLHAGDPGFTCCEALPTIDNPVPSLSERIDRIFVRGALEAERIVIVGASPSDRTSSGLWPSDHAGLVAGFDFEGDD